MTIGNLKIINETGNGRDTKVYLNDTEVKGITRIELNAITPGELIEAKITIHVSELKLQSEKFGFIGEVMEEQSDIMPLGDDLILKAARDAYPDLVNMYGNGLINEAIRIGNKTSRSIIILQRIKEKTDRHGRIDQQMIKEILNSFTDNQSKN